MESRMIEKQKLLGRLDEVQSTQPHSFSSMNITLTIDDLRRECEERKELHNSYYKILEENESLNEKLKYYTKENPLDNEEIRGAIALIKSRKEAGTYVDFLGKVEEDLSDVGAAR
jgi:uncharacterized protein YbcC (UPF0753/DUF2309 family)